MYFYKGLSLRGLYSAFIERVELLKDARDALSDVDANCKVLEPIPPSNSDLHRQVVVKSGVFLHIRIDPEASSSSSLPHLAFFGRDEEVAILRANLAKNADDFDAEFGLVAALEKLLEVEFPRGEDVDQDRDAFNVDCGICYGYKLENEELKSVSFPDISCGKCSKSFHRECLYQWLQESKAKVVCLKTSHLTGKCLYCETPISCSRPGV